MWNGSETTTTLGCSSLPIQTATSVVVTAKYSRTATTIPVTTRRMMFEFYVGPPDNGAEGPGAGVVQGRPGGGQGLPCRPRACPASRLVTAVERRDTLRSTRNGITVGQEMETCRGVTGSL